ncbi:hypothetical protein ACLMAJ_29265 [Nocardia sp. KC 131]|uniref:hypothetical protein n=1 Tax=Nocardia arseniciresistens TaxID=3392119 RepID=UPI00398F49A4
MNALSRTQGAVGDAGKTPGAGITAGEFDPTAFLGGALPKLFGLFDLSELLVRGPPAEAPEPIAEQLDLIGSIGTDFAGLVRALEKARETLDADLTASTTAGAVQRLQELRNQVQQALDALPANSVQPLIDALTMGPPATDGANPAAGPAGQILAALDTVEALRTSPFIATYLRALIERPFKALHAALQTVQDAAILIAALRSPLENSTIRYEWPPKIKSWPEPPPNATPQQIAQSAVFLPKDPAKALAIAVEIRTGPTGEPQSDVSAQLRNFALQLLPGEPLMAMTFGRIGFRVGTRGRRPVRPNGIPRRARLHRETSPAHSVRRLRRPALRRHHPRGRDGGFRSRVAQCRSRCVHDGEHLALRRLPRALPRRRGHGRVRVGYRSRNTKRLVYADHFRL